MISDGGNEGCTAQNINKNEDIVQSTTDFGDNVLNAIFLKSIKVWG